MKIRKVDRLSRRPNWKVGVKVLREDEQQIEEQLVLKKEKVYMPKYEKLRVEITWLHYNILAAGYGEKWKTTELVIRNYWQLEVIKNVEKYNICQRMKN